MKMMFLSVESSLKTENTKKEQSGSLRYKNENTAMEVLNVLDFIQHDYFQKTQKVLQIFWKRSISRRNVWN